VINVEQNDVNTDLKSYEDTFFNIVFADPPYNLGSKTYVDKSDGKIKFTGKAQDFMNKWTFSHEDWKTFFEESFRTLKHGGFCILYGMDRQQPLIQYYAIRAGFEVQQSLYWYFISSFPKSADLSKNIDKRPNSYLDKYRDFKIWLKSEIDENKKSIKTLIEECGFDFTHYYRTDIKNQESFPSREKWETMKKVIGLSSIWDNFIRYLNNNNTEERGFEDINRRESSQNVMPYIGKILNKKPIDSLAQKYDGFKYSISPFKQVVETIMVFRKPTKNKSVLDDVYAYEEGDKTIHPAIINIDGGRVPTDDFYDVRHYDKEDCFQNLDPKKTKFQVKDRNSKGRYPSQMFLDEYCADRIDEQSGEMKSEGKRNGEIKNTPARSWKNSSNAGISRTDYNDSGGASRINHIIPWTEEEMDLLYYEPKVSKKERNAGLEGMDNKFLATMGDGISKREHNPEKGGWVKNNHPTLKSIKLNQKIFELFSTPDIDNLKVYVPFAGTFSEVIGVLANGVKEENLYVCELSEEYTEIGKARLEYWKENNYDFKNLKTTRNGEKKSEQDKKEENNNTRWF
jgi:hypothetical protein